MKYLVISIVFLLLSFLIITFVGTEIVAHNLIVSAIVLFVLIEAIDWVVTRTMFREN